MSDPECFIAPNFPASVLECHLSRSGWTGSLQFLLEFSPSFFFLYEFWQMYDIVGVFPRGVIQKSFTALEVHLYLPLLLKP